MLQPVNLLIYTRAPPVSDAQMGPLRPQLCCSEKHENRPRVSIGGHLINTRERMHDHGVLWNNLHQLSIDDVLASSPLILLRPVLQREFRALTIFQAGVLRKAHWFHCFLLCVCYALTRTQSLITGPHKSRQ